MNATAGGGVGPADAGDEETVQLVGVGDVVKALTAEQSLLNDLVAVAEQAAKGNSGPVRDFIDRYWLSPLKGDREATGQCLADLQAGDVASVREAADEELRLVRLLRREVGNLAGRHPGRATLQAALKSYDDDFRTEAGGSRSILNALS